MPKFFVKNEQITDNKITIIGEDVNHIKNVLRLKIDDNIHVCNVDTSTNYTCGISKINNIVNIKNICNLIDKYDIVLLAYENEKNNKLKNELTKLKNKENLKIGVIIGPEGGLEEQEVEILKEAGAKVITLGNRILRTETVALVVTGIIMYELENLEGNK